MQHLAERAVGRALPRQSHHSAKLSLPLVGLFGGWHQGLGSTSGVPDVLAPDQQTLRTWLD